MEHNCVRNPETGACYVCKTPMRLNYHAESPLDAIVDATQHPAPAPVNIRRCACGNYLPKNETQCADCFIAEYTKAPVKQFYPTPASIADKMIERAKSNNSAPLAVSLDSILDAMETRRERWN